MSNFKQLTDQKQIELAMQFVIMDAIGKGHTNKEELIQYMFSETFTNAVTNYRKEMNK